MKDFLRAFGFTMLILGAPLLVLLGCAKSYEAIRLNGFGERVHAVDFNISGNDGEVRFFDSVYEIDEIDKYIKTAADFLRTAADSDTKAE